VATTVRELGRLDVLVQSAGITVFVPHANPEAVSDDDWQRVLGVNLVGAFQMARAVRAPMEAAGAGAIVNVSSVAGLAGIGSSIPYCASKAGMNSLTITLARALAPKIRVNAVAPGFITGRWLEGGLGAAYEPIKKAMEAKSPLGRVAEPEDVSAAIVSLICGSDMVTGVVMPVEGGMLIAG
jgi:3-oxoacyl-[acyl-carrier protein] reductase